MIDFISNARRDLRLPLRLDAQVAVATVGHAGQTEDVGARGCRLSAPLRLLTGTRVRLLLVVDGAAGSLSVDATVVWRQDGPARRHGVAFDAAAAARTAAWFDEMVEHHTALLHLDRVPDRIGFGERVYLARSPLEPPTAEEALVLRFACAGASVAELRAALGARWSRVQRALYALLNSGVVAIERGGAGDSA
jgi:hypothetical protein